MASGHFRSMCTPRNLTSDNALMKQRHILVVEDKLPRAGLYVLVLTVCGCEADSKGEETKEILAREPTQRLRRRIR